MIFEGANTFSKMHRNYPENYPKIAETNFEQNIMNENRVYFDTVSSLGCQLFDIDNDGMLSIPHYLEQEIATKLKEKIPFIEMVRYGCNGADATEGAIRYARAFTKRQEIFSVGYHTCQSAFTWNTPPAIGCIDGKVRSFKDFKELINELKELREDWNNCAAVIIEPVILDMNVKDSLEEIRALTKELGIVLIFDEIITGFRVQKFCISNLFNIQPDLILLGKALADGYPLSIIAGRKDIMNVAVFHSYTFAGFPASLERAKRALNLTESDLLEFWNKGEKFRNDFNALKHEIKLDGYATRGLWTGPEKLKFIFWQEMVKEHVLLGPVLFPRILWNENHYAMLLSTTDKVLRNIELNNIQLEGRYPVPLFKRN